MVYCIGKMVLSHLIDIVLSRISCMVEFVSQTKMHLRAHKLSSGLLVE